MKALDDEAGDGGAAIGNRRVTEDLVDIDEADVGGGDSDEEMDSTQQTSLRWNRELG